MVRNSALVVLLDRRLRQSQLLLRNLRFDLQIGQLVSQSLGLDTQALSLPLSYLNLLFKHDFALDCYIVLGLDVLQRRRLVAGLALEVVVLDLHVSELELQGSLCVAQAGDLLLEGVLRIVGFGLALLVLGLRCWSAARSTSPKRCSSDYRGG